MARPTRDVKENFLQRLGKWIDAHPRTGWYFAVWALLVTLNTVIGLVDTLLMLLT